MQSSWITTFVQKQGVKCHFSYIMANRGHLKHQKPTIMCYSISPYHFLYISIVLEDFQGIWGVRLAHF